MTAAVRNGRRTLLAIALLAVTILMSAAAGSSPASAAPVREPLPSRLLVTAREFSFSLSRPKVDAGPAIVELYNYGEDPHDLRLQRVGGNRVYALGETAPGERGRLEPTLRRASRYRLWCSLPGHAALGMRATLRTSRKRPGSA